MTRKTSLITALVGVALVLGVPAAWGVSPDVVERAVLARELSQRSGAAGPQDAFERAVAARQRELSSIGAYADSHNRVLGPGDLRPAGSISPDAFVRAVDAANRSPLSTYPDAFTRAVNAENKSPLSTYPDAFTRAVNAENRSLLTGLYPDALERAVGARSRNEGLVMGDHHSRVEPVGSTTSVTVASSGREIEWPQIGIGFGVGLLLAIGLVLAMRMTRIRPLAH